MTSCWSHPTARLFRSLTSARNGRSVVPVQPASRLPAWKISHYSGQAPSSDQRGAGFLPPEQSPILSFSACLAENPGSLPTLPHPAHKSCHYGFIYSTSTIFCAWKKRIGILREARVE